MRPLEVGVGEYVDVAVHMGVYVMVKVKPGRIIPSLVAVALGNAVGEKKSKANASRVNARSRGVAVIVLLGARTISSCVSTLPPAIMTGKPNASTQAPRITNKTMAPCAFTPLVLLSHTEQ